MLLCMRDMGEHISNANTHFLCAQLAADLGSCLEESIVHAVLQEGGSWWLRYNDTPLQPAKLMLMQCTLLSGGTPLYCQLSGMFS